MSNVAMLKAMARNYDGSKQQWDHLDTEACVKAANEIEQLQAKVAELEADLEFQTNARIQDRKDAETNYKNWNAELKKQLAAAQEEIKTVTEQKNRMWFEMQTAQDQLAKAEQRVAEACALQVATETRFHRLDAARVAKEIRSGEWRKFVKEV